MVSEMSKEGRDNAIKLELKVSESVRYEYLDGHLPAKLS